jgi:hypothetical protein
MAATSSRAVHTIRIISGNSYWIEGRNCIEPYKKAPAKSRAQADLYENAPMDPGKLAYHNFQLIQTGGQ